VCFFNQSANNSVIRWLPPPVVAGRWKRSAGCGGLVLGDVQFPEEASITVDEV